MLRLLLTASLWKRLLKAIQETNAYQTENLRMTVEGILWRFRTGAPWRDLPNEFGPWKTVFNRFNTWSKSGVWHELFVLIRGDLDNEWNVMDGAYIKPHQHASGGTEPSIFIVIGILSKISLRSLSISGHLRHATISLQEISLQRCSLHALYFG